MVRLLIITAILPLCVFGQVLRGADSVEQHLERRDLATSQDTVSRIVGGQQAENGEFPFFVEIGQRNCGGMLIARDIVLTAAHCERHFTKGLIIGGIRSGRTRPRSGGGYGRVIDEYEKHPNFEPATYNYDFAVLKLNEPVPLQPIAINFDANYPNSLSDPKNLIVMGLGRQSFQGESTEWLLDTTVRYTDQAICERMYPGQITWAMFCAGVSAGENPADSCNGDSGGPIITRDDSNNSSGSMTAVGVVSWGWECADPTAHGVYARISSAATWIRNAACYVLQSSDSAFCESGGNNIINDPPPTQAPSSQPTPIPSAAPSTVPSGEPTAEPSLVPSESPSEPQCKDLPDRFTVDSVVGEQDCTFLKNNFERYGYLCRFLEVAAICRYQCQACVYFDPLLES